MSLFDLFKKKQGNSSKKTPSLSFKLETTVPSEANPTESNIIPVNQRTKSAYPSKNGELFPHEILILHYAPSFQLKNESFARFWWYRYGVSDKDIEDTLKKLLRKGYITIASLNKSLEKQTVANLKDILVSHSLPTTGKKADLIQRMLNEIPEETLNKLFPNRTYELTEQGSFELKHEEYVIYMHNHTIDNLDIWSMNKLLHKSSSHFYEVLKHYLEKRCQEHFRSNDFGLYRNCRLHLANLLKEQGNPSDELAALTEVMFYDLTGMGNNFVPEHLHILVPHLFPYNKSFAKIAPAVVKKLFDCQARLGLSDVEFRRVLTRNLSHHSAPLELFADKECIDILFFEYTGDLTALEKLYEVAEKRLYKKYPDLRKKVLAHSK